MITTAGPGYEDIQAPKDLRERDGVTGRVKMFDAKRNFGFITVSEADGGGDVFLHVKEVFTGKAVREGDAVEFDTRFRGPDALRAVDITLPGERARRQLAQMTSDARESGRKRELSSLDGAFSTGKIRDDLASLPAGLMSAEELRDYKARAESAVKAESEERLRAEEAAERRRENDEKAQKKMKSKDSKRQAAKLSFTTEEEG